MGQIVSDNEILCVHPAQHQINSEFTFTQNTVLVFQLFRHNEGNFYTAVLYSLRRLGQGGGGTSRPADPPPRMNILGEVLKEYRPSGADSLGAAKR